MPEDAFGVFTERVHARIGLLGNPSDGFYGKVISFSLQNFFAEVRRSQTNSTVAVSDGAISLTLDIRMSIAANFD